MEKELHYTKAFIKPMVQAWLAAMEFTQESPMQNRMFIELEQQDKDGNDFTRYGTIQFWDKSVQKREKGQFYGDIMELSIYDVKFSKEKKFDRSAKNPEFYLHFEMVDFEFVLEQLSTFFDFLYNSDKEKEENYHIEKKIEHILICCTAGLTSGYFANLLQEKLELENPNNTITCNGMNVSYLPKVIDDYDIVLLAPQVHYMIDELQEKYGDKVQMVSRVDFATFNMEAVLKKLDLM